MAVNNMASKLKGSEKDRVFRRYNVDFLVHTKAWRGGTLEVTEGHGTDVSQGGLALKTKAKLQIGETVTIEMTLPITGHQIRVTGSIQNEENGQYGVEFVGLGEMQRNAIDRLCATLEENNKNAASKGAAKK